MTKILWLVIAGFLLLFLSGTAFTKDPSPPQKTPELLSQGKKLYDQNCVTCHGPKGDGKGQLGASLKPAPTDFTKPLKEWPYTKGDSKKVFEVISKGIPNSSMVKWDQLPEQERWALIYFVVDFASPKAPAKKAK